MFHWFIAGADTHRSLVPVQGARGRETWLTRGAREPGSRSRGPGPRCMSIPPQHVPTRPARPCASRPPRRCAAKRAEGRGDVSQTLGRRRCAGTVPREAADGPSLSPRPERASPSPSARLGQVAGWPVAAHNSIDAHTRGAHVACPSLHHTSTEGTCCESHRG